MQNSFWSNILKLQKKNKNSDQDQHQDQDIFLKTKTKTLDRKTKALKMRLETKTCLKTSHPCTKVVQTLDQRSDDWLVDFQPKNQNQTKITVSHKTEAKPSKKTKNL